MKVLPEERAVIVGAPEGLGCTEINVRDFRPLAEIENGVDFEASVQIRHRSAPVPAKIQIEGTRAKVRFLEGVKAVAPGQAAVFYRGDQVLGGGWMTTEDDAFTK